MGKSDRLLEQTLKINYPSNFPDGPVVKTAFQHRRCRFDPWSGSYDPACLMAKKNET